MAKTPVLGIFKDGWDWGGTIVGAIAMVGGAINWYRHATTDEVWALGPIFLGFIAILATLLRRLRATQKELDDLTGPTQTSEWERLEERFGRIPGEVEAFWHEYATGKVKWEVHPDSHNGGTMRDKQRFESEARTGGSTLQRLGALTAKFPVDPMADPLHRWLNAVAAMVDACSSMQGSGRDENGYHDTGHLHRLVDASKVACARLAAEIRSPTVGQAIDAASPMPVLPSSPSENCSLR